MREAQRRGARSRPEVAPQRLKLMLEPYPTTRSLTTMFRELTRNGMRKPSGGFSVGDAVAVVSGDHYVGARGDIISFDGAAVATKQYGYEVKLTPHLPPLPQPLFPPSFFSVCFFHP